VSIPLTHDANYVVYEYACQEGNQAVENILRGGRMKDAEGTKLAVTYRAARS